MFNFADKVKNTGSLGKENIGVIIRVYSGQEYSKVVGPTPNWDRLYPNWRDRYVYGVAFKESKKPFTLEQCDNDILLYESLEERYDWTFPEKDLSLV